MITNILLGAALMVLICFSAFFSGSEISIATANKFRIKHKAGEGNKRAISADFVTDNPAKVIPTLLVGNNLVNIAASSAATVLAFRLFSRNAQTISTITMTIVLVIFGESLPKIIASARADDMIMVVSPVIRFFMVIFKPIVGAVTYLVGKLSKLWTPKSHSPTVTSSELCTIVDTIEQEGVFTEKESELIKSAIEFTDVTARDILIPRVDVFAFDIDDGTEALLANADLLSFSRIPVYRGTIDNVIGILSTKRFMKAAIDNKNVDIESLLMPPVFVHMTRPISSILMEFQAKRAQVAIVVDEFGGMMGLLTLEDILEEIFGEIYDESDDVEPEEFEPAGENSFIVDGSLNVLEMFELLDYKPEHFESEYTTVGGWATEMLDRFPVAGDKFEFERLTVEVLKAQSMRVEQLKVTLRPEETDEE